MKKTALFFLISLFIYIQNLFCGSILSSRGLGMNFEHPNTRAMGMGDFTIADTDVYTISRMNPASQFTHQISRISIYYFAMYNHYQDQYNGTANSQYSNFDGFSFFIPLHSTFGITSGLTPLTRMDYKISFDKAIGSYKYIKSVKGNGGLNSFDLSCHWAYKNFLSIGVTGRYIFGNINTTWRVDYDNNSFNPTKDYFSTKNNGFNYKVGIILKPVSSITIGAVYTPEVILDNKTTISYIFSDSTLKYEGSIQYPGSYGFGISYQIKKVGLIGIDYLIYNWNSLLINDQNLSYTNNTNKFSFGFESAYSSNPAASYFKQIRYRLGYYHKPYLSLDPEGNSIYESCVTFGFGLPIKGRTSEINFAFNYGKRGSLDKNGLSENIYRVSLSLSIGEKWFQRRF